MAEEMKVGRPNRRPTHPGALLRETVIPAIDMPVSEVAARLRVTRQQLHRVLSEKAGISPEMAIRLGKFCGNGPDLWIRMQEAYDLWAARKKLGREIDRIQPVETTTAV